MPSPFPGIDPYIESSGMWGDFHGSMVASMRNELNARLPRGFAAKIELYVWFHEPEAKKRRRIEPDVYVVKKRELARGHASAALAPPQTITLASVERRRQKLVQIVDLRSRRVVTAIEMLSPSNKTDDREVYLAKRNEVLANRVNLVEIDLLRGGQRLPLSEPPPDLGDYYVMVCRGWQFPKAELWPFSIRDRLPEVPIPLTPEVGDVLLPLQPSVNQVYETGRYADEFQYDRPLSPRLNKKDAAWAKALLADWSAKSN